MFPPSSITVITMFQLFLVASASAAAAIFFASARLTVFFSTNCADAVPAAPEVGNPQRQCHDRLSHAIPPGASQIGKNLTASSSDRRMMSTG